MIDKSHETLVATQFGPRAAAYVESVVHREGDDINQLVDLVRGHSTARALDMGCGGGHVSFNVAPHVAEVIAYDLSEEMLGAVAREASGRGLSNLSARRGLAERLPFNDGSFDFVFSRYSAHHWSDLELALREARRVLRSCGAAVFMDVVSPGAPLPDTYLQAVEILRDPSHVRDYALSEWSRALAASDLVLREVTIRRLRLDFSSWIGRMQTRDVETRAIRALQSRMSKRVRERFEFEADGSFTVDAATMIAVPLSPSAARESADEAAEMKKVL